MSTKRKHSACRDRAAGRVRHRAIRDAAVARVAGRPVARLWGHANARVRISVRVRVGEMGGQVGASRQERLPVLDRLRLYYVTKMVYDDGGAVLSHCSSYPQGMNRALD